MYGCSSTHVDKFYRFVVFVFFFLICNLCFHFLFCKSHTHHPIDLNSFESRHFCLMKKEIPLLCYCYRRCSLFAEMKNLSRISCAQCKTKRVSNINTERIEMIELKVRCVCDVHWECKMASRNWRTSAGITKTSSRVGRAQELCLVAARGWIQEQSSGCDGCSGPQGNNESSGATGFVVPRRIPRQLLAAL